MNREGSVVVKNNSEYDAKHKTRIPSDSPIGRLASLREIGPQCHQMGPSARPKNKFVHTNPAASTIAGPKPASSATNETRPKNTAMRIERIRSTRGVKGSKIAVSSSDTTRTASALAAGFHRSRGEPVS